jgi:hypothetical protein
MIPVDGARSAPASACEPYGAGKPNSPARGVSVVYSAASSALPSSSPQHRMGASQEGEVEVGASSTLLL